MMYLKITILCLLATTIYALDLSTYKSPVISAINRKRDVSLACIKNSDCGEGTCEVDGLTNSSECKCTYPWITVDAPCDYQRHLELVAFLVSFFVGGLGVDWFILASGNGCYICAGVTKLLTCGFCGVWWLVDWIRILAHAFPDGRGIALAPM